ncbi:MAG: GHKL domain-containing protein [Bacteroides sp.]|nr:GHKL domain-containing protein [Bacteroides sp.]MCM1548712.1 GHKL domain-containing protein [Clostridium sp.]
MSVWGYTFFTVICHAVLCIIFIGIFEKKPREFKKGYQYFLFLGLVLVHVCITELLNEQILLRECLTVLVLTGGMLVFFPGRRGRVVMLTLLYQSGSLAIDYVIGSLLTNCIPVLLLPEMTASAAGSGSILICENMRFYLILLLKLYLNKKSESALKQIEQLRTWGSILFPFIILIFCLSGVRYETEKSFWYTAIALLLMNIVLSEWLNDMRKRQEQHQKEQWFRIQKEHEASLYRTLGESYERQKKREHEYKNQILCITAMVQEEKYSELKAYLTELDKSITSGTDLFDTNHSMVNTVLNLKYQEARKKDILLVVRISDLSELPIADEDVVTLLSNLLDNAFEACEACKEKVVKLKFVKKQDRIILSVRNTLAKPPQIRNGIFQSSKEACTEEHGIGIGNICELVEKYGGSYSITYDDNEFCFAIVIFCRKGSLIPSSMG